MLIVVIKNALPWSHFKLCLLIKSEQYYVLANHLLIALIYGITDPLNLHLASSEQ